MGLWPAEASAALLNRRRAGAGADWDARAPPKRDAGCKKR